MTPEQARALAWEIGVIAEWYLREDQKPIYELMSREKNPFIECARRYGKTTSILCYVLEQLIRNPGWICRWCEPDKNQAREIVIDELQKIQRHGPKHLRFVYQTTDSVFKHPNGSKLYLRGVNHDRGDSARGPTAHIIVADEFGTWKDPDYIVTSALRPQLQTTNGPFIFASTPPEDLGHAYYTHRGWALADGRFIQRTIYQNESLTPERLEEIKKECRGENTPAWKREYLCEPVTDPERLVIPEYDPITHDIEDGYERPPYFNSFVGIDLGFHDNTASLFGYWDFEKRELVIEQESVCSGRNSRDITETNQAIEKELWGELKPLVRVGDNDKQQLYDMLTLCNYAITPARKDDKLAAINALRLRFQSGKIKIKKRCENLRYQLRVGLWNERKTDFLRGEKTGHLDAIDALIYLSRTVALYEHLNPYPKYGPEVTRATHHINPDHSSQGSSDALRKAFRPFQRGSG